MHRRNHTLDFARTFAIFNMVLFHFCFDYFVVYGQSSDWYRQNMVHLWQQLICWTFILVSGASWHYGKKHWRRGAQLNLCGLIITAVTVMVLPREAIYFGILSFLGCAVWLLSALEPILKKCSTAVGLPAAAFCFWITYSLQTGNLGWGAFQVAVPAVLYTIKPLVLFGMPYQGFVSSDYFPLMPWFFLYLCGYFLWRLPALREASAKLPVPATHGISSRSLLIYMLHQPLCMGIAYLAVL